MVEGAIYLPKYQTSWALIIGINDYAHASPLDFARNDAEGIAKLLEEKFRFPRANIKVLLDGSATGGAIRKAFLEFSSSSKVNSDDRLIVFFAGHGHTVSGKRGEVGFLVPSDGNVEQIDTLIRWDELTRDADLVPAKHIFFLMDACYGGLALTRKPSFGSMRFLGDMLQRYARQVLTAGKADETVSDGNGVRPGHSIFTAHLLNGLEGAAATEDGIITANGVMAYVYERVAQDQYSRQTPHYGFVDGDGDFVFDISILETVQSAADQTGEGEARGGGDILINTSPEVVEASEAEITISDVTKELLSDPSKRIKLDDFVSRHIRKFLEATDLRNFPMQGGQVSREEFLNRVVKYEEVARDLQHIVILLAKWGDDEQLLLLEKIFVRLAEADKGSAGIALWLRLTWYPLVMLMYSAGISALAARKYSALRVALAVTIQPDPNYGRKPQKLVLPVLRNMADLHEEFKWLPGVERAYVPRSEHLYKILQPILEDELLLGRAYEKLFDEFEILVALTYADFAEGNWGPPGRFVWKFSQGSGDSPFDQLIETATREGSEWGPVKGGLFEKSAEKFKKIAAQYRERIKNVSWW